MTFEELGLGEEILKAVGDAGYSSPTPIQAQAIPQVLMGRDILGCAQTGTGKTASFTLPMIEILGQGRAKARMPRSLILEPTRELAAQVAENFNTYGKYHRLKKALLIGGESMNEQTSVLNRGVDVLIATPGRLIDLFDRGGLLLTDVKILVIDEADRMLDMGFIPDVERIVSMLPKIRQTLFFSATMPPEIRRLADAFLMNPKTITVAPPSTPAATVTQGLLMIPHSGRGGVNDHKLKREALRKLIGEEKPKNALIFCNRKRDVSTVFHSLKRHGFNAGELHGDMSQPARSATLEKFKNDEISLLVCSDVAARGLDISDLSHVFNYDIPTHPEDYIHRIGRTGRAGKSGRAFTLAMKEDGKYIERIKKLIGRDIPPMPMPGETNTAPASNEAAKEEAPTPAESGEKRQGRGGRRGGRDRAQKNDAPEKNDQKRAGKPEAPKAEASGKKDPAPRKSDSRQSRGRKTEDKDSTEVGLGKHVPAFLLREIPPQK
ncbi:MAG: DEAD/DEAH box helicase [Rhodospirillales bacterium]|nr:DEAD/DEAH box helicase [Rhodospirillales bacterium]MCW8953042.1 DEAD/DEAH box helicase [Rhodospirillales bacterium]